MRERVDLLRERLRREIRGFDHPFRFGERASGRIA